MENNQLKCGDHFHCMSEALDWRWPTNELKAALSQIKSLSLVWRHENFCMHVIKGGQNNIRNKENQF